MVMTRFAINISLLLRSPYDGCRARELCTCTSLGSSAPEYPITEVCPASSGRSIRPCRPRRRCRRCLGR
uniref:Putative secreted protein n=1 Tax=Anopheles triannulatus TaxID=58253 RepID=A0A2M4B535_9DIPT